MKKRIALLFAAFAALTALAQQPAPYVTTPKDVTFAESILDELQAWKKGHPEATTPELMCFAAKRMLGQPYVAGTLDKEDPEALRLYLTQTDCILFVETVFNLAETVQDGQADFDSFAGHVRQTRYRGGVVDGYASRVHYTTEWIRQGEARGVVEDLSAQFGEVYDHPIFFMSTHGGSYRQLKNAGTDPVAARDLALIAEVEKALSAVPQYYIPENKIKAMEGNIRTGDIIGFMSATPGLDIAHVVMAYVHDGVVGFIHASMGKMEVIVDPKSIADYALSAKGITGIKVVRPVR